ncbi:glutaredoxin 3 [Glossina fuscipes fuscipes]
MSIIAIKTVEDYEKIIGTNEVAVLLFSADWADQCKQVGDAMEDLGKMFGDKLRFGKIIAEDFPEISMKHLIEAVPTVIFFKKGTAVDRIDGVNIAALTTKCKNLGATVTSDIPLEERLKTLINKAPLMIFMKGGRDAPRCGFSKQLIAIITETGFPYETFDILTDEEVRQGLKTYSDWPTYPQVYVKGELVGGLDIIKELQANNELEKTLRGE